MTWAKTVTLYCDADGCHEWAETGHSTVSKTRNNLSDWTHRDGLDFCPECGDS